jgi:hypothetical protein
MDTDTENTKPLEGKQHTGIGEGAGFLFQTILREVRVFEC